MRYVNPLVEGSSPSPVISDRTRQKATPSVKTPGNPGVSSSSTPDHPIPSSRQKATQADPKRPLTTPQNTPQGTEGIRSADPDLAGIVDAWPGLPEAIKARIVALVKAAGK